MISESEKLKDLEFFEAITHYKKPYSKSKIPIGVYYSIYHNCPIVQELFKEWADRIVNPKDAIPENFCSFLRMFGYTAIETEFVEKL